MSYLNCDCSECREWEAAFDPPETLETETAARLLDTTPQAFAPIDCEG